MAYFVDLSLDLTLKLMERNTTTTCSAISARVRTTLYRLLFYFLLYFFYFTRWRSIGLVSKGTRWSPFGPALKFVWLTSLKRGTVWGRTGVGLNIHLSYN